MDMSGVICISLPMLEANKLMVIFKGFALQNAWISWVGTCWYYNDPMSYQEMFPSKLTNFAGKKAGKFTISSGEVGLDTGKLYFPGKSLTWPFLKTPP